MLSQTDDSAVRTQALNPEKSFIIQAPAGSGKTSLLVARVLTLLAKAVNQPEEIVAITFTRKAASEMQLRILETLQMPKQSPCPDAPHEKHLWELAHQVLEKDTLLSWHLIENPSRLNIMTIDAFCASLLARMPMSSTAYNIHTICDQPHVLYEQAALKTISLLSETTDYQWIMKRLLSHLDNRYPRIIHLMVMMLGRRDLWLNHLAGFKPHENLREYVEKTLYQLNYDAIVALQTHFHTYYDLSYVNNLWQQAQTYIALHRPDSPFRCDKIPLDATPDEHSIPVWKIFCSWLLTTKGEFRKSMTVNQGVPGTALGETEIEKEALKNFKASVMAIFETLRGDEGLLSQLQYLQTCPPLRYDERQWPMVEALGVLLPLTAGILQQLFIQVNQTDFIGITQHALTGLGSEEVPTDLALSLDYTLKHILIDEFQDTSNTQYELLLKLTQTWEVGDGKTVFLVGDPMQSIYRFRGANVGLFMQLQTQGLSQVDLVSLHLTSNFRSDPNLIHWVNNTFTHIFPRVNHIQRGGVAYHASHARKEVRSGADIQLHATHIEDDTAQTQAMLSLIQAHHAAYPSHSIAVLVRSRNHIDALLPILKQENIPAQAVEMQALEAHPIVQDLLMLTRALNHLTDDIAWAALLRAPWCGLTLKELTEFMQLREAKLVSEWLFTSVERNPTVESKLSRLKQAIQFFYHTPSTLSFSDKLYQMWLALSGPYLIPEAAHEYATCYFELLREFEQGQATFEVALWEAKLAHCTSSQTNLNPVVEVMTIHKAKGLEFDCVIIPHAEKVGRANSANLLKLQALVSEQDVSLLLAPIPEKNNHCEIYSYLNQIESSMGQYELARLLYVAATRAKHQLHILAKFDVAEPTPKKGSFLHLLWRVTSSEVWQCFKGVEKSLTETTRDIPELKMLSPHWQPPYVNNLPDTGEFEKKIVVEPIEEKLPFSLQTPRLIGIVLHDWFAYLSAHPLPAMALLKLQMRHDLIRAGIAYEMLEKSIQFCIQTLKILSEKERGRWILHPHREAQSEYALSVSRKAEIKQYVLDRTFIEDDVRWIIDYKTGEDERSETQYRTQLNQYATLFVHEGLKIHCGLYYPFEDKWISWQFGDRNDR